MTDWHLQQDESGDVFLHVPNGFYNLGPSDEVLTRFADFFGDEGVELPAGFIVPESGGEAG
jgi:hypothetical protein